MGAYVFVLYTSIVTGDARSVTGADRELLNLATDLRSTTAADILAVVTDLGSFAVVAALVLAVGAVLVVRRRFAALAGADRGHGAHRLRRRHRQGGGGPGPVRPDPLQPTQGSSFPSGHAAYSTIWVAVALVLARSMPGLVRDAALVGVALVVAVAIGLSRVYLRVHYWSDVAAGWALGAAILGTVGAVVLVVAHLRNNQHA